jgi:hypothetical protein
MSSATQARQSAYVQQVSWFQAMKLFMKLKSSEIGKFTATMSVLGYFITLDGLFDWVPGFIVIDGVDNALIGPFVVFALFRITQIKRQHNKRAAACAR